MGLMFVNRCLYFMSRNLKMNEERVTCVVSGLEVHLSVNSVDIVKRLK